MIRRVLWVTLLDLAAAFGQPADIHAEHRSPDFLRRGPAVHGDRYEVHNANLADLIGAAYGVRAEYVIGGPSWLELDRFDVIAEMRANATPEEQRAMLQALLAERFKLAVHRDTQPVAAFALTAGKHPTLKRSDGSKESGCEFLDRPEQSPDGPYLANATYSCTNMTMKEFADQLLKLRILTTESADRGG